MSDNPTTTTTTTTTPSKEETLSSQDTSAVYDRQIRLWGADAQSKISSAVVLYINITGVSSEILKNLVLAGVKPAICDGRPYPEATSRTPSSFFPTVHPPHDNDDKDESSSTEQQQQPPPSKKPKTCSSSSLSVARAIKPHVLELNPFLTDISIDERPISSIPDDYFSKFDVVVASRIGSREASRIAAATTSSGGFFFLAETMGTYGCAVLDLGRGHTFKKEIGKDKLSHGVTAEAYAPVREIFDVSLGDATGRWDKTSPVEWTAFRTVLEYHDRKKKWPVEDDDKTEFVSFAKDYLVKDSSSSQGGGGACCCLKSDYLGDDDALQDLAKMNEYSPVCAVLGGVVGNEVIKALSGKGEPANNVLLFHGEAFSCRSFLIKKKD